MKIQTQKQNSYQTGGILLSPHVNTSHQPIGLLMSAHSKKSATNTQPNGFTMRSLKSQNSGGTQGPHTNRGEQMSLQQKSPHMSDVQDPYAYFNMHQQQTTGGMCGVSGQHTVQVSVGGVNQMIGIKKLDTKQMSASGSSHQVQFTKEQEHGVKSCRPNLYSKQQLMISQRGNLHPQQVAVFGQSRDGMQHAPNLSPTPTQDKDASEEENKEVKSDNVQRQKFQSPHSGSPFILNQSQIQFNQINDEVKGASVGGMGVQGGLHSGNNSMHYYNNTNVNPLEKKGSIKGIFGFGSAGSGSRGSNFNSSSSTFPAAPVQKLSEVRNPQKLMSFRFVNRKVTKVSEISLFKNLQELDLSGNLLQEQVRELCCLNFLKRLSLCNNKIVDMWHLPSSIEILNLSHNMIKEMSESCCQRLKNITTLDISNNKLETLKNFEYMHRIKRLLSKNNYVRSLQPLQSIQNIFEIDLEGNAIDSHKDFLSFIKGKNDLIIINLHQNPLMVEVNTIEKFNEDLIQNAPELVTKKGVKEIEEIKDLLGLQDESKAVLESSKGGDESQRFNFHLIEELGQYLSFLKVGILYRNKRVYNKLKAIQLKTKRSASNYSNSSHSFVNTNNPQGAAGRIQTHAAITQDRNSANLTSPHGTQNSGLLRSSNPQHYHPHKSAGYSPIVSIKSQRYEDVEAIYDNIVEQEELKRLKQKKIMAKKRKQHKQQMLSQLDDTAGANPDFNCVDSMNGSSEEFSSAELEDSDDDLDDMDETLDLMEPRDDFDDDDSCLVDQDSSRLLEYQNFGNYQANGEEVMSQTMTSDLEADLHSYKKGDEHENYYNHGENLDDHDYLNGSTAGFGKKLREINREINQEQQDQSASHSKQKQFASVKKEMQKKIESGHIKLKGKFDLNLDAIKKEQNQKFLQSDLKINIHDRKDAVSATGVTVINFKKQIQTAKNSNDGGSQNGDQLRAHQQSRGMPTQSEDTYNLDREHQQQLNQSFSLKNICQGDNLQSNTGNAQHEVESLMMNKQIQQRSDTHHPNVNETTANNGFMPVERKIMQNSQSQNLNSQVNQSVNQSLLNDSMVQSVTQTSKKTIIPNFKLDLSKCKQDEEFAFGEESMHSLQSDLNLSSIMLKDKSSSHLTSINQDQVDLEDILLQEKEHDLDNMKIHVARDSYRQNEADKVKTSPKLQMMKLKGNLNPQLIEQIKKSKEKLVLSGKGSNKPGVRSVRNPTPAPEKQKDSNKAEEPTNKTERVEGSKAIQVEAENKCDSCKNCVKYQQTLIEMNSHYQHEFQMMKVQIMSYQQVILKIKSQLNLSGDLEFQKHKNSKNVIKLSSFADKVHLVFRRMYADLEKQRIESDKLSLTLKAFQTRVFQQLATSNQQVHFDYNTVGGPIEYKDHGEHAVKGVKQQIKSATYRNGQSKASIDVTDSGTPEVATRSAIQQLNSAQIKKLELEKASQFIHSAQAMVGKGQQQPPKVQGKGVLQIKMTDIQKAAMPSLSSSEMHSVVEEETLRSNEPTMMTHAAAKSKKGAAKTMRNFPLSASESQHQQSRINSNPKIEFKEGVYHNYEANTFSSQYSLSQNQTAVAGQRIQGETIEQDGIGIDTDNQHQESASKTNHQLQLMPSGVKILKKGIETNESTDNLAVLKKSSNTSRSRGKGTFKKDKQMAFQQSQNHFDHVSNSLDPKSSHKSLGRTTSNKGSMKPQQIGGQSTSNNKVGQQQLQQQELGLQKSLEMIKQESSQLQNYKTSRIPTTTSKSFADGGVGCLVDQREQTLQQQIINCENLLLENPPHQDFYNLAFENQSLSQLDQNYNSSMNAFQGFQNPLVNSTNNSAQIQTEKRKQKLQVTNPMVLQVPQGLAVNQQQSYSTQRKNINVVGIKSLPTSSGVPSVRPASRENKTQRLQRQQLLNKSGAVAGGNISSLQQTYDQDLRGQSINTTMGLIADTYYSKRPQSVAESGGRKFQKIQQQMMVFNKLNQQNSTNKKNKQSHKSNKSKNKSTEKNQTQTQSNRQAIKEMGKFLKNTQVKFSQSRVEQQVNNLSANIQNIKTIKQIKYNTNSKVQQTTTQTSGRQPGGVSMQGSALSKVDEIVRQTSKMRVTNVEEYTPLDPSNDTAFDDFADVFGVQPPSSTGRRTTLQDSHPQGFGSKQRRRSNHAVTSTIQGAPRKDQKVSSQNEINLNQDSVQTAQLFMESMKQRNSSMGHQ